MKTGSELIAEERQRQIEKEGWSAEHDEQHRLGEMVSAAACYLAVAQAQVVSQASKRAIEPDLRVLSLWPWDDKWWKPSTSIRNLVKAGALIAAEIDRVQRLNKHRKPYAKVAPEGL